MNPLKILGKLLAGSLLLTVVVGFAYTQQTPVNVTVEVADEAELVEATAIPFDEIFESVAHATPIAPAPVQTATIRLNAPSFDESVTRGIHLLSYAPSEPIEKKVPRLQTQPKPEPKKPTVLAQLPGPSNVRLSSENWEQMNGHQRWQFVEGYITAHHLSCPPSGMTRQEEEAKLTQYGWQTIYNFDFNNCSKAG